jgi:hypothetical protein
VQLDSHVPNAHAHVSMALDVRAIMRMQNMRADNAFNACKTCGQAATVRLWCSTGPIDHSQDTTIVPGDPAT